LEFNVPFQHKYGYIREEQIHGKTATQKRPKIKICIFSVINVHFKGILSTFIKTYVVVRLRNVFIM